MYAPMDPRRIALWASILSLPMKPDPLGDGIRLSLKAMRYGLGTDFTNVLEMYRLEREFAHD